MSDPCPTLALDRAIMIAWRKECYRSAATARTFSARLYMIPGTEGKALFAKALAYIANSISTLGLLAREKPHTVFCINLPAILPLVCVLHSLISGCNVILDFHSGALSAKRWRMFIPLYRWIVRRAPFTICHNRQDGEIVAGWGGRVVHLLTLPQAKFRDHNYTPSKERTFFLFSCSFAEDEPVQVALEAMAKCSEYEFLVSGNYLRQGYSPSQTPPNVQLAGFMSYDEYLYAMSRATAVLTLSTRPHIMQMAVHEAITMGAPVITNNSPALKEVLGEGGVYCTLDTESIVNAFHVVASNHPALIAGIVSAKAEAFFRINQELDLAKRYISECT